jgi:hypothetical protein
MLFPSDLFKATPAGPRTGDVIREELEDAISNASAEAAERKQVVTDRLAELEQENATLAQVLDFTSPR